MKTTVILFLIFALAFLAWYWFWFKSNQVNPVVDDEPKQTNPLDKYIEDYRNQPVSNKDIKL